MSATQPNRSTAVFSGNLLRIGGQNPTVKIVWGDEDRGVNASALSTWDNTVTISTNRMSELFPPPSPFPIRKRFIIFAQLPKMLEVRLFRAPLECSIPPHLLELQIYGDAGHFDDDNFSVTASPLEFSGLKLWLDASELSSAGSTWTDNSGNGNSATKTGSAVVTENAQNGLSLMNYTGNGQYHDFSAISDIRTVFG